jgi:AcrR family transcriptional regulator
MAPAEQLVERQRWHLISAAAEVLAERGYARMTSKAVALRAGVSSRDFYEHFEHLDACLLAAYEVTADSLWDLVSGACTVAGEWPERLLAAVEAAIAYIASEPALAYMLSTEAAVGVAAIAAAKERLLKRLSGLLCAGRGMRIETANDLPLELERHLLGGADSLIGDGLLSGDRDRLRALVPQLGEILVLPFRAPASAGRA